MDGSLKAKIKTLKKFHKKGALDLDDNINLDVEVNYQILINIIEELNLIMDKDHYEEFQDDRNMLVYELALLEFDEEQSLSESEVSSMIDIIKEYIDVDNPVLIFEQYMFVVKNDSLQELYKKALTQIKNKVFSNIIF